MNFFKPLSNLLLLILNYGFNVKIDYLKVKEMTFFSILEVNSLSTSSISIKLSKTSILFLGKKMLYVDYYLVLIIGIVLLAIAVELALAKNVKMIKKENKLLLDNHSKLLKQNSNLQQALDTLEENRQKNVRKFQVIAHDLRSPMAGIVALSAFVIDENKLGTDDLEVIRLIHNTGNDSLKFISDLLDTDTLISEPTMELVDLNQLLFYCIAQLQPKASEKKQKIIFEKKAPIALKLNRENIWRVIHNLITNAIKFSPFGSEILISFQENEQKVIISVKDQGIGIPFELQSEIFGSGEGRKREGTAGEKSFGMGLSIAKQIVENHNGNLSFKSNVDVGTTFFMELPRL
jgi:signal transduction histidine kinase